MLKMSRLIEVLFRIIEVGYLDSVDQTYPNILRVRESFFDHHTPKKAIKSTRMLAVTESERTRK